MVGRPLRAVTKGGTIRPDLEIAQPVAIRSDLGVGDTLVQAKGIPAGAAQAIDHGEVGKENAAFSGI